MSDVADQFLRELVFVGSEGAQRGGTCCGCGGGRSALDTGDHLPHVVEFAPSQSILAVVRDAHKRISESANHVFPRGKVEAGREDPIFREVGKPHIPILPGRTEHAKS